MPVQVIYVIGVCFLGLFLFAFFWFVLWAAITPIATAVTASMSQYEGNTTYTAFGYAATFMTNLWYYLLAIAVIGLLLWSMIYSQRRGEPMYE